MPDILPTNTLNITALPTAIREIAAKIPFRQSMIGDYLTCPANAMYRWLFGFEEQDTFFAAVLGSAGHKVIYSLHNANRIGLKPSSTPSYTALLEMFIEAFEEQLKQEKFLPKLGKHYDDYEAQRDDASPEYVQMLKGYAEHAKNRTFYSTIHEQTFVIVIENPFVPGGKPFLFTGQIDQAGYYEDGAFSLRDIKFRMEAFRPSRIELDLNIQLTTYAYGLKFGVPSCESCKPQYDELAEEFTYHGPCDTCKAKIGTAAWPQLYPVHIEMIWMRDFLKYTKDEYTREVVDKTAPKVRNPATGRMVFDKRINEMWLQGYKEGDYKGEGFLKTARSPKFLDVAMSDILRIAQEFRNGNFFRKPGKHCSFWCKHRDTCLKALELQVDEVDVGAFSNFATLDPFAD